MTTFNFRGLPDCFARMIRFFVLGFMKSVADSIHFLIYLVIYRLLQMEDLLLRTHPCICSRGWFPLCHTSARLCCPWCCAAWSTQRRTAAQEGSNFELNSPVFPMAHGGFPRGSSSIRIPKKQKGVVRHLVDPIRCWNFPSSQWGWQRRLLLFPETKVGKLFSFKSVIKDW